MALEPITRQEKIIAGQDLTPITRMEKFLKEFGGSGGSGGAQPDWNAAEGKPGHILNRPFYSEVVESVDVEVKEQTITSVTNSSGKHSAKLYNKDTGLVATKDNTHVIVVFDGELFDLRSNNNLLGNKAILGAAGAVDTGEPFYIGTGNSVTNIYTKTPGDHTIAITVYKEETVYHTIDPKFLPGGGGAQPDWNAAEGEPGHILNKPFGDEEVYILPETELTFVANEDMGGACQAMIAPEAIPVEGNTYTITFDGVTYECTALYESGDGVYFLGNLSALGGEDSGEPFCVMIMVDSSGDALPESLMLSIAGETTTSVTIKGVQPKPIAPEYAPNTVSIDLVYLGLGDITTDQLVSVDLGEDTKARIEKQLGTALRNGIVQLAFNYSIKKKEIFLPSNEHINTLDGHQLSTMFIYGASYACYMHGFIEDNMIVVEYYDGTFRAIARRLTFS